MAQQINTTEICECQQPGHFNSGLRGALAHVEHGLIAGRVERCDACQRFSDDHAAYVALLAHLNTEGLALTRAALEAHVLGQSCTGQPNGCEHESCAAYRLAHKQRLLVPCDQQPNSRVHPIGLDGLCVYVFCQSRLRVSDGKPLVPFPNAGRL